MSTLLALAALLSTANASPMVITLDSGGTVRGELAWYEYGGDCQISVTEGELMGSILVVPCDRLTRIERPLAAVEAPVAAVEAPVAAAPPAATEDLALPVAEFAPVTPTAMQEEPVSDAPVATAATAAAPSLPALEDGPGLSLPSEANAYTVPSASAADGVPLDNRVSVDPALLGDHPAPRVPSPPRTPRVPPGSTGATVGW